MNAQSERHPTALLPDYVLGLLTPEETAVVEAHLETCALCQEEAWALAEPLVALTETLPKERPPERVWQNIQDELTRSALLPEIAVPSERLSEEVKPSAPNPAPRSTTYTWPLTAAFALVLALGSLLWGARSYDALQQVRANEELLSTFLARPQVQKVVLENVLSSNRSQPLGSALLVPEQRPGADDKVLFVLQSPPAGRTYQAWGHTSSDWDPDRGETLTSLRTSRDNVFEVDAQGFASLYLSLEPVGGSPQPTEALSKVSLLNPVASAPLEITSPEDGASVSAPTLIVSGVVDPSITGLSYTLNGGAATETTAANNRFSFTVSGLREGRNTLEVRAANETGERVTRSVQVFYTP